MKERYGKFSESTIWRWTACSLLEYENGQREAYLTVKTTNGRCVTAKDAARLMGQAVPGGAWSPAKDSRSIINRQYAALRFEEDGAYHMLFGAARVPKQGERCSGDNYTFCESPGDQVIMSLSDGMGSGEEACRESEQVVDLTQQLLEDGIFTEIRAEAGKYGASAVRGPAPATLDLSCVDLHTAVLEVMKLGAVPTFIIGQEAWNVWRPGRFLRGFCGSGTGSHFTEAVGGRSHCYGDGRCFGCLAGR